MHFNYSYLNWLTALLNSLSLKQLIPQAICHSTASNHSVDCSGNPLRTQEVIFPTVLFTHLPRRKLTPGLHKAMSTACRYALCFTHHPPRQKG